MVLLSLRICKQHNRLNEGLQRPYITGLGTKAVPLFLSNLGCLPKDCTQAVCGVYVRIFPSIVLYFCSNVFGFFFFTLVASRMVFRVTCSMRFLIFLSTVRCTPLYLKFILF